MGDTPRDSVHGIEVEGRRSRRLVPANGVWCSAALYLAKHPLPGMGVLGALYPPLHAPPSHLVGVRNTRVPYLHEARPPYVPRA